MLCDMCRNLEREKRAADERKLYYPMGSPEFKRWTECSANLRNAIDVHKRNCPDCNKIYCSARKAIEERKSALSSKLNDLTNQLVVLVGADHGLFLKVLEESRRTRRELSESRQQLQEHRSKHGCDRYS
jgi:hypothetical protein